MSFGSPARRAVSSGFRWVEFTLLVAVGRSAARHNHVISRYFVRPGSIVCDYLVPCRHHQSRFAGLIHAAKPARVEKRTAFLFFVEVSIFPDLHRIAAARARIAIARDHDTLLSLPFPAQIASHENTN